MMSRNVVFTKLKFLAYSSVLMCYIVFHHIVSLLVCLVSQGFASVLHPKFLFRFEAKQAKLGGRFCYFASKSFVSLQFRFEAKFGDTLVARYKCLKILSSILASHTIVGTGGCNPATAEKDMGMDGAGISGLSWLSLKWLTPAFALEAKRSLICEIIEKEHIERTRVVNFNKLDGGVPLCTLHRTEGLYRTVRLGYSYTQGVYERFLI